MSSSIILVPQSSENKTKTQQDSHHLTDLQITANNCAISVSNFKPQKKKKKKKKEIRAHPH
jgi:hypothetical protein